MHLRDLGNRSTITPFQDFKKVKEPGNKAYLDELLKEVVWLQESNKEVDFSESSNIPKYIAPVEKPDKQESIMAMKTRFT